MPYTDQLADWLRIFVERLTRRSIEVSSPDGATS